MAQRIEISESQFAVPLVALSSPGNAGERVAGTLAEESANVYNVLDKRFRQDGELAAAAKIAQLQKEEMEEVDRAHDEGRINEGFTKERDKILQQKTSALLKGTTNKYEQQALQSAIPQLGVQSYARAHAFEAMANVARREATIQKTLDDSLAVVSKDPTQRDAQKQAFLKTIDNAFLPVEKKEEWKQKAGGAFTEEVLFSMDPVKGLALMKDEKFISDVPTARRRQIETFLKNKADADEQNKRSRITFAQNQYDRGRRLAGEAAEKEGYLLVDNQQMTPEWIQKHKSVLDPTAVRVMSNSLKTGGSKDSADTLNQANRMIYENGEDAGEFLLNAQQRGTLSPETTRSYLKDNAETQDIKSDAVRARQYISSMLDPNNDMPFGKQMQAQAIKEFNDTVKRDKNVDKNKLSQDIVARYGLINFDKMSILKPIPKFAKKGTDRKSIDIDDTRRSTNAHFLQKYEGDWAKIEADPEFIEQAELIEFWETIIKQRNATQKPTPATK